MSDSVEPAGRDRALLGDTTTPTWALASIVIGLLALTGSITMLSFVASAIVIAWVTSAGRPDEQAAGHRSRGGLNPPGPWT